MGIYLFLGFLWIVVAFMNGMIAYETDDGLWWFITFLNIICSALNFLLAYLKAAA